jgi:hypothetical protein
MLYYILSGKNIDRKVNGYSVETTYSLHVCEMRKNPFFYILTKSMFLLVVFGIICGGLLFWAFTLISPLIMQAVSSMKVAGPHEGFPFSVIVDSAIYLAALAASILVPIKVCRAIRSSCLIEADKIFLISSSPYAIRSAMDRLKKTSFRPGRLSGL